MPERFLFYPLAFMAGFWLGASLRLHLIHLWRRFDWARHVRKQSREHSAGVRRRALEEATRCAIEARLRKVHTINGRVENLRWRAHLHLVEKN